MKNNSLLELAGRSFVTKSHNVCKFTRVGKGGLIVAWRRNPTEDEVEEVIEWMRMLLNTNAKEASSGTK